jgi:hypothetical protein
MSIMINSEISKQFLLEENAIKGFKKAVDNNQQRLAMQILTEIIDTFVEMFDVLVESEEDAEDTTVENVEPKIEEVKEEKKPAAKKAEAKEEKVQTEEK